MNIKSFLYEFFDHEDLEDIATAYSLPVFGTDTQIIERIASNVPIEEILEPLYKDELKDICFELDLPVSGTKDDLIELISNTVTDYFEEPVSISTVTTDAITPPTQNYEPLHSEIDKLTVTITSMFRLVITGMLVIYVTYHFMASLIPDIPLWVKGIIGLIGVSFIYFVRDYILGALRKLDINST